MEPPSQESVVRNIGLFFYIYFLTQLVSFIFKIIDLGKKDTGSFSNVLMLIFYISTVIALAILVESSTGMGGTRILIIASGLTLLLVVPTKIANVDIFERPVVMYLMPLVVQSISLQLFSLRNSNSN